MDEQLGTILELLQLAHEAARVSFIRVQLEPKRGAYETERAIAIAANALLDAYYAIRRAEMEIVSSVVQERKV